MDNDNNKNNKIRRKKATTDNENANKSSNNNNSKKVKKKRSWPKILGVLILVLVLIGSAAFTGLVFASLKDVQPVTKALLDSKTYVDSNTLYATGDLLSTTESSNSRDPIAISKMPEDIINAIVAIEDERFYEHNGVDLMGLARSLVKTILGDVQGGSTLPMQVSKMLLTTSDQTLTRKVKDIYYAYEMDKTLTKNEILEVYLNNFHVGKGLNGVQTGAQGYFSKDAKELTLAECALLAGATKHPSKYAAYTTAKLDGNETADSIKNKLIYYINTDQDILDDPTQVELDMIDKLWDWGVIPTKDTYLQLKSGAMVIRKAVPNDAAISRRNTVLGKMLEHQYISQDEYNKAISEPININLPQVEDPVQSSVEDYIDDEVIDTLQEQGYTYDEAFNMYYNGGLIINTTLDPKIQNALDTEYKDNSNFPGHREVGGISQPQSAMVILDHQTGHIKGLIGGRNINVSKGFNRAINPRQPGSTIKPLTVYTPAIDTLKITQSTSVSDVPDGYKFEYKNNWKPKTTTPGNAPMTLRKAMAYSSNSIAVKTAEMLGNSQDEVYAIMTDYLRNFGITTVNPDTDGLSMAALALGGMDQGISPLEMAAAYGALANGGTYIEPTIITTITTFDKQLIAKVTPDEHKVVDKEVAYVVTDMLRSVVTEGLGSSARLSTNSSMPVAGKTGTTNGSLEAWFVGYTPYYVGATYIADDQSVNGEKIDKRSIIGGSKTSAKLWSSVMSKVHENLSVTKFKVPDGVYFNSIDLVYGNKTSGGSSAAFASGTSAPGNYKPEVSLPEPEEDESDDDNSESEETPSQGTDDENDATPIPPAE